RKKFPRGSFGESSSRLSRSRDPARDRAGAETAKARGQEQTAEAAGLSAIALRYRRRSLPKFRRRKKLGSSKQISGRRVLSNQSRRFETVLPNRRRIAGQRKLGRTERRAKQGSD